MVPTFVAIAFVDIAGYTALTEAHGDVDATRCALTFYDLVERCLGPGTRIVKRIGDAVMLVGNRPEDLVHVVARAFDEAETMPGFPALRAGIHAGAVVEEGSDYFGAAVNVAARIGAHARSGEILCSTTVAAGLPAEEDIARRDLGAVSFKNVDHPVEISVLVPARSGRGDAIDPVCRMRVARPVVQIVHRGTRYAFCSEACAERFRAAPDTFAG